jgi:CMP-N-acetylneuraminic acid synthetase
LDKNNNLVAEDYGLEQRQEAKKVFYVNGSFYLAKCKNLLKFKNFHRSKNMKPILCNPDLSIDVNNLSDLYAVRKKFL